jgi:hypothetical protein
MMLYVDFAEANEIVELVLEIHAMFPTLMVEMEDSSMDEVDEVVAVVAAAAVAVDGSEVFVANEIAETVVVRGEEESQQDFGSDGHILFDQFHCVHSLGFELLTTSNFDVEHHKLHMFVELVVVELGTFEDVFVDVHFGDNVVISSVVVVVYAASVELIRTVEESFHSSCFVEMNRQLAFV